MHLVDPNNSNQLDLMNYSSVVVTFDLSPTQLISIH